MVDVMLVLLIIFMVTAPMLTSSIEVDLQSVGEHEIRFIGTGGVVLSVVDGPSASFDLAMAPSGYVRALVENHYGQRAWVQPVFVP